MADITIRIPEQLIQPLVGLIDAGLRATGLRAAATAAELAEIIERAIQAERGTAGTPPAGPVSGKPE